MSQKRGLGRGLDAIFKNENIETKINPMSAISQIALDRIDANPSQPRQDFASDQLEVLAASIKQLGVIQPITVKPIDGGRFLVISGERRLRAARMAGLSEIPVFQREADDIALHTMALVENIQRENLNPIEIALGMERLIEECSLTQESLAEKISMRRSSISNYLRLLRLPNEVQLALKKGLITMGHAKAIASIEDQNLQIELLKRCIEKSISVREAERFAQEIAAGKNIKKDEKTRPSMPIKYRPLSNHLEAIFPKGVEISTNSKGGGKIIINFSNQVEVQQLIEELNINGDSWQEEEERC